MIGLEKQGQRTVHRTVRPSAGDRPRSLVRIYSPQRAVAGFSETISTSSTLRDGGFISFDLASVYARGARSRPIFHRARQGVIYTPPTAANSSTAISSWWVNLHGHAHPWIASAIAEQARKLEHVIFAGFTHDRRRSFRAVASRIASALEHIFFSDDGSTAWSALKWPCSTGRIRKAEERRLVALETPITAILPEPCPSAPTRLL